MSSSSSDAGVPDDLCDWLEEHAAPAAPMTEAAAAAAAAADENIAAFAPITWEVAHGSTGWAEAAAASLGHNGFCVLRGSCGTPAGREACAGSALGRLEHLFGLARQAGLRPRHDVLRFSEVCARTVGGMRYDMRLPTQKRATPLAQIPGKQNVEVTTFT